MVSYPESTLAVPLRHNKVCELEDFRDEGLATLIRDIFPIDARRHGSDFPSGFEYRKYWEIAMAVRALREHGALHRNSVLLGVGAGTESTLYYLTGLVKMVFATDLYIQEGSWRAFAPMRMLWDPDAFAPFPYDSRRLVVQHMDGRSLNYPDSLFDGIFSAGSIEHFGGLRQVASSAYEMGRVVKPGGVVTLSTEFCVSGPSTSVEWPGLNLFSADEIQRYVTDASGLEPVDVFSAHVSASTRATAQPLSRCVHELETALQAQGDRPRAGEMTWSTYPHLLLERDGYTFGSVHIALRKTERYPVRDNHWARPTPEMAREWLNETDPQPQRSLTAALGRTSMNALRALRSRWSSPT